MIDLSLEESSLIFKIPRQIKYSLISRIQKEEDLPLNNTQVITLMVLSEEGPVCMNKLGRLIGMDKGSFTQVIDKLVKTGYADRKRDTEDRRSVKVMLTKKGTDFTVYIQKHTYDEISKVLDVLDDDEISIFIDSLKNIEKILNKIEGN